MTPMNSASGPFFQKILRSTGNAFTKYFGVIPSFHVAIYKCLATTWGNSSKNGASGIRLWRQATHPIRSRSSESPREYWILSGKYWCFLIFTISWPGNSTFPKNLHFRILIFISTCNVFCSKKSSYPDPPQPSPQSVRRTALYQTAEGMKKLFVDFWKKQFEFRTVFSISFFIQPASLDQVKIKHNVSNQTNSTEIASKRINLAKFDDFY